MEENSNQLLSTRPPTFKQQSSSTLLEGPRLPEARTVTASAPAGESRRTSTTTIVVNSHDVLPLDDAGAAVAVKQVHRADPPPSYTLDLQGNHVIAQQHQHGSTQVAISTLTPSAASDEEEAFAVADKSTAMAMLVSDTAATKQKRSTETRTCRSCWLLGLLFVLLAAIAIGAVVVVAVTRSRAAFHPLPSTDGVGSNDNFGSSVALSNTGKRMVVASGGTVRAYQQSVEGLSHGGVSWDSLGQPIIVDSDPPHVELIGSERVIDIDMNRMGDYVVVGYPAGGPDNVGIVQIYRFLHGGWVKVTNPDLSVGQTNDRFGSSVSINAAGNVIAVGAPGSMNETGRVYSFQESASGAWELREGDIEGVAPAGKFGGSVSLSASGNRVAVGGRSGFGFSGRSTVVQVYEFNLLGDFAWSQLGPDLRDSQNRFSTSWTVDMSADGNRYVASNSYTREDDFINTSPDSLVVQVLEFNGTTWTKMGENIHQGALGPKSGYFVGLSDNGLTMVMGDPGTSSGGSRNGHAHVYEFVEGLEWVQKGPDVNGEADGDLFGYSVAISGDGSHFAVGAPLRSFSANDAGRVMTYSRSGR